MRKIFIFFFALFALMIVHARPQVKNTVIDNRLQTITGFGAASCNGAMARAHVLSGALTALPGK